MGSGGHGGENNSVLRDLDEDLGSIILGVIIDCCSSYSEEI